MERITPYVRRVIEKDPYCAYDASKALMAVWEEMGFKLTDDLKNAYDLLPNPSSILRILGRETGRNKQRIKEGT